MSCLRSPYFLRLRFITAARPSSPDPSMTRVPGSGTVVGGTLGGSVGIVSVGGITGGITGGMTGVVSGGVTGGVIGGITGGVVVVSIGVLPWCVVPL